MATYYALTTCNAEQDGWSPLASVGTDRAVVEAKAHAIIGSTVTGYGTDIRLETEHKNLVVVPVYKLHLYGWKRAELDEALDRIEMARW